MPARTLARYCQHRLALRLVGLGLLAVGAGAQGAPPYHHAGPLACQDNEKFPMLPIFHIIGNVTQSTDGTIKCASINDASGVTHYNGLYHVWHQCCQNHWCVSAAFLLAPLAASVLCALCPRLMARGASRLLLADP